MPDMSRTAPALAAALLSGLCLGAPGAARADCADMLILDPQSPQFLSGDSPFSKTQDGMNCFAWQTFLALNWPVDPAWPGTPAAAGDPDRSADVTRLGVPGNPMGPTVWQSFMPAPRVFKPDAAAPDAWGSTAGAPAGCTSLQSGMGVGAGRQLQATAKGSVHPRHGFNLSTGTMAATSDEIIEAAGGWLTDQDGNLVFFERLMGQAEYTAIVSQKLYDAVAQRAVATNADGTTPKGLQLPAGVLPSGQVQPQSDLGAFELKAAWRVLTHRPELMGRYITAEAYLTGPDGTCREEIVGLVGLHVIHKTKSMPGFLWSTFEQVDNVPLNIPNPPQPPAAGYSFHDPNSSATPNQQPRCTGGTCDYGTPIQVTRVVPMASDVAQTNAAVQARLRSAAGDDTVMQYYHLINTLWSVTTTPPPDTPRTPLNIGQFQSSGPNFPVSNVTMETYVQSKTCMDCHQNAFIAGESGAPGSLASDFSFLFQTAGSSQAMTGIALSPEFRPQD